MSFWKRLFGGRSESATTGSRMFKPSYTAEQITMEIVKQLASGTNSQSIVDSLVCELGMSRELASNMVTTGQYAIQDNPEISDETEEAIGYLVNYNAKRAASRYTEAELENLDSFEVKLPEGDGRCSDNSCPCPAPGTLIPRGTGYIYISPECIEFRRDARTDKELQKKAARLQKQWRKGGVVSLYDPEIYKAILVCEQGAKKRNLDLEIAAADARLAWSEGRVPLPATPKKK